MSARHLLHRVVSTMPWRACGDGHLAGGGRADSEPGPWRRSGTYVPADAHCARGRRVARFPSLRRDHRHHLHRRGPSKDVRIWIFANYARPNQLPIVTWWACCDSSSRSFRLPGKPALAGPVGAPGVAAGGGLRPRLTRNLPPCRWTPYPSSTDAFTRSAWPPAGSRDRRRRPLAWRHAGPGIRRGEMVDR